MDFQGESREMLYKHSNSKRLNDLCELQKDGTLYMIS